MFSYCNFKKCGFFSLSLKTPFQGASIKGHLEKKPEQDREREPKEERKKMKNETNDQIVADSNT